MVIFLILKCNRVFSLTANLDSFLCSFLCKKKIFFTRINYKVQKRFFSERGRDPAFGGEQRGATERRTGGTTSGYHQVGSPPGRT
jgi:hypothetical protein